MSPRIATAYAPTAARGHASSIADWLLDGPAQLTVGPHAGTVVGTVDADGHATYGYPEIAGYYLQWLAWHHRRDDIAADLSSRADAVQHWLDVWLALGHPLPTRLHLADGVDDWRNRAEFCFDLAMVLRGLSAAADAGLLVPDPTIVAGVVAALDRLIAADGMFNAYRAEPADTDLPERWSTRRGGFLTKAAAGVIVAGALPGMTSRVMAAAEATWHASVNAALDTPHDELHPQLYAFEGILSLSQHPRTRAVLPQVAVVFDALLALSATRGTRRGALPERRSGDAATSGPERVDVLAQTLRVGCLLQQHLADWVPDHVAMTRVRHLLAEQIRSDGSVPFAIVATTPVANVWAAMFADQALALAMHPHASDERATDPLIV
ncbi:MAG: hypothetical protein ABI777_03790 [Betaproteobacteria bacterium]